MKKSFFLGDFQDLSKEDLLEELWKTYKEKEKLKKKLRKYENPHTPPSKDERKTRTRFVSKTGLSVGKKTGYKGRTRTKKPITRYIFTFRNICPNCRKHVTPRLVRKKTYEEIPEPQPVEVIQTEWGIYECACGHSWESKTKYVPETGIIGKNAQTHITLLRFDDRLPLRKTVSSLNRTFGLDLTSKAIYDITKRVADRATPEYLDIKKRIKRAKSLHIDETKIKIQGSWYYIWIFRSRCNIFYVVRKERNKNVLDEILGYRYKGIIICDGLSAYKEYTKYLQRCWAHILRETEEYADKFDDAKPLHKWMQDLFKVVKSVSIRTPVAERQRIYDNCTIEMEHLIQVYSSYSHLSGIITKIKNGLPFWFTRILHPQIEPTNNNAERPLREIVVMKRIMGTLRNLDGANVFAKIMTLVATWKLQGKSTFSSLRAIV